MGKFMRYECIVDGLDLWEGEVVLFDFVKKEVKKFDLGEKFGHRSKGD